MKKNKKKAKRITKLVQLRVRIGVKSGQTTCNPPCQWYTTVILTGNPQEGYQFDVENADLTIHSFEMV